VTKLYKTVSFNDGSVVWGWGWGRFRWTWKP